MVRRLESPETAAVTFRVFTERKSTSFSVFDDPAASVVIRGVGEPNVPGTGLGVAGVQDLVHVRPVIMSRVYPSAPRLCGGRHRLYA